MSFDLVGALDEIERERGIDKGLLVEAVEAALISAYRRHFGTTENVVVRLDKDSRQFRVFVQKRVVEEVNDPDSEVSLAEAREIHPGYEVGDIVEREVVPRDFGRIAAQTAKQVVVQRIREAERDLIFEEFAQKEGDIITGQVQRVQGRNVFVDLGRVEAILPPQEQIPGEYYGQGERIKLYVAEVKKTSRGPQIVISRSHPNLVKRLFELEVPEIYEGVVEVMSISREAGGRTKIAVRSQDDQVDPVGACVGQRGMRVQTVVNELNGEKIDIIKWSDDLAEYVANALSPSRVTEVTIEEEEGEKVARVIVPDQQLSLAIGRAGQNARLAAKLTGIRIDIKSESQVAEEAMRDALRGTAGGEGGEKGGDIAALAEWLTKRPAGRVSDVWEQAWSEALKKRGPKGHESSKRVATDDSDDEFERRWEDDDLD